MAASPLFGGVVCKLIFICLVFGVVLGQRWTYSANLQYMHFPAGWATTAVWNCICDNPQGGVVMSAGVYDGKNYFHVFSSYDGNGIHLWTKTVLGNETEDFTWIRCLNMPGGQGNVFMGYYSATEKYTPVTLLMLDSNGNVVTSSTFSTNFYVFPTDIKATTKGGFVVSGAVVAPPNSTVANYAFVVMYDRKLNILANYSYAETEGTKIGSFVYNEPTSDGGLVLAGWGTDTDGRPRTHLIKVNATGDVQWAMSLAPFQPNPNPAIPQNNWPMWMAPLGNDNFVMSGDQSNNATFNPSYLITFNANGTLYSNNFIYNKNAAGYFSAATFIRNVNGKLVMNLNVDTSQTNASSLIQASVCQFSYDPMFSNITVDWANLVINPANPTNQEPATSVIVPSKYGFGFAGTMRNAVANDYQYFAYLGFLDSKGGSYGCNVLQPVTYIIEPHDIAETFPVTVEVGALESQPEPDFKFVTNADNIFAFSTGCVHLN